MDRRSSPNHSAVREFINRADRVAGHINVLLVVVALGLATLDFTFLVTEQVVDHLPPITQVNYDNAAPAGK